MKHATTPNIPPIGEKIYLYRQRDWSGPQMHADTYLGETSRSYLVGHQWGPEKYPKKEWTPVSPKDGERRYAEIAWVRQHRYRIGSLAGELWDYSTLRTIAKLIGYDENTK